jgi:hypothetical protein
MAEELQQIQADEAGLQIHLAEGHAVAVGLWREEKKYQPIRITNDAALSRHDQGVENLQSEVQLKRDSSLKCTV